MVERRARGVQELEARVQQLEAHAARPQQGSEVDRIEQIEPALAGTPLGVDLIVALACQETGEIWPVLRKKNLSEDTILALCVGDTLDADRGRRAFPQTKADLIAAPDSATGAFLKAPLAHPLHEREAGAQVVLGADIEVPQAPTEAGPFRAGPIPHDPRAEADFGYRPEYDLDRGLREYIAFLKSGRYAAVA